MQPALFLDRDGVLNVEGGDYVTHPDGLSILPDALEAVAEATRLGWRIFVFTNQSGVGKGILTREALDAVHARLRAEVLATGGRLEAIYACIHHPDEGCECRKPKPGMLLQAAQEHGISLAESFAVGDSPRDIAAARAAGCKSILVLTGHTPTYDALRFPEPQPDYVVDTLRQVIPILSAVSNLLK